MEEIRTEVTRYNYGSGFQRYSTEILVTTSASLCLFINGLHLSWLSQSGSILTSGKGPITITTDEFNILVTCSSFGGIFGALGAYFMVQYWSQSKTLLLSAIPAAIAFLGIGLIPNFPVYCILRFIVGINIATVMSVCSVYSVEITSTEIRGTTGIMLVLSGRIGALVANCLMPYIDFQWICISFSLAPVIQFILCLFLPESPYLKLKLKDVEGARKSLCQLRKTELVDEELYQIKKYVDAQYAIPVTISKIFNTNIYRKAFLFGIILVTASNVTGFSALTSYSQILFESGSQAIPASLSGIILSVFAILFSFIPIFTIDRLGRKLLLFISAIIISLSLLVFGLYYYLIEEGWTSIDSLGFLPLLTMVVYTFGLTLGLGSLIWVYFNEIMPTNVRILGCCFLTLLASGYDILVVVIFNYLAKHVGIVAPFLIFPVLTMIVSGIILVFFPETKGKTFEEIQNILAFGKHFKTAAK